MERFWNVNFFRPRVRPSGPGPARPPLVQAFGQVRFPIRSELPTLEGVAPIQERLDPLFPFMNSSRSAGILLVGPAGGRRRSHLPRNWQSDDGAGWSVALSADTATLAVGPQYGEFSEFSDRFQAVLTALGEGAGVSRADRLGVGSWNPPRSPPGEADALAPVVPARADRLSATEAVADGTRLITSITQSQLAAPPVSELSGPPVDIQAIVRDGLVPANTVAQESFPHSHGLRHFLTSTSSLRLPNRSTPTNSSRQLTMLGR